MDQSVFQEWLDTVGDAFFNDDFETYFKAVALPLIVKTATAEMQVVDAVGLRKGFDAWQAMLTTYHATDMIRTCRGVHDISDTEITGLYDTEILANGQRAMPPFTSKMTLRKTDTWRATYVESGMTAQTLQTGIPGYTRLNTQCQSMPSNKGNIQ